MRILVVGPSIERSKGGMATVIKDQLANAILNDHHNQAYLISHVEGSVVEKALFAIKSLIYLLFYQHRYDILHFHTAADASFYRKSALVRIGKWLNKKTIMHMHGSDFDSFYLNSKPIFKKYIKSTLSKGDKIIVLSDFWKRFFQSEFPDLQIEILHNGVDLKSYAPCITNLGKCSHYLFLGRLGERKGIYDLIQAIDLVVNVHDRKQLKFYLAGDGEIDKVKVLVKDHQLEEQVKILGWLSDSEKRELLKDVGIVILPSYDENLPMALIEGMASGKVIISTYAGGIPDLVKNNINGYLFNAGAVDELVKLILFVSDNPALMIPICQNNINAIKENFNLDKLSSKLNSIYDSLYSNSS